MNDQYSSEEIIRSTESDKTLLFVDRTNALAESLATLLMRRHWTITTAESCTGGMLSASFTEIPGSSAWFEQGAVTYSNRAKELLLDVPEDVFVAHGAVSEACVRAMAAGALRRSGANVAVSISGIAGPDGATADKPVGTVWIGWAVEDAGQSSEEDTKLLSERSGAGEGENGPAINGLASDGQGKDKQATASAGCVIDATCFLFDGDRRQVREQAVLLALRGTISRLTQL